ncbi:putative reverse transcriptase domain-containing protein [Tanacetum coccineum]
MAETMDQNISKTRADYGSGVARHKIEDKDNFELKGQFLKELRTNTFSSSDHEDANEHIEKVLEIVDLFHIPTITIDQVMLRAFSMSLNGAILDSRGTIPSKAAADAKKGSHGLQFSKAHSEASHINNSIPRKEKDPRSFTLPCFINNVCFDNALVDLGASINVMPLSTYLNLGLGELAHTKLIYELADRTVKYPKGIAENVLVGIGKFVFPVDFIILYMPEDIKVPLILGSPFLSIARAKIDVYKRKITLRVGEEKIIFTSVKPSSSLIKTVYMLSLRERIELDLKARLMGETLVNNRSLDLLNRDYIELNDLNEPFELRIYQGDDLMPTIKEGEVIEEFKTRDDELNTEINDYLSYCDYDKKIHIDYKMVYKGNNVVRALMNVPIFVGTFFVVTDFTILEDMDAYRDEGIGDVSDDDKKNGISHPYQKLKGFYKGVLNLGPDYIRDARTEE